MSSIPIPDPGSRKTNVSIGGGSIGKTQKAFLGKFRTIETTEPVKRRKKRKGSKLANWTTIPKLLVLVSVLVLLIAIGEALMHSRLKVMKERTSASATPFEEGFIPAQNAELVKLNKVETELFTSDPKNHATSFVYAKTVEERSGYVRDASNVGAYPEQARTAIPMRIKDYDVGNDGEGQYAQFLAEFSDGGERMIAVVPTDRGPKVDWDCYARFGTAAWPNILGGQVEKAEVRVIVRPSNYYNFAFSEEKEWLAYEVSSPDLQSCIFAYAKKGSDLATHLEKVFVSGDGKPMRLILELTKSAEGLPHRQFVLSGLIAQGWVKWK